MSRLQPHQGVTRTEIVAARYHGTNGQAMRSPANEHPKPKALKHGGNSDRNTLLFSPRWYHVGSYAKGRVVKYR